MAQIEKAWESFLQSLILFLPNLGVSVLILLIAFLITKLLPRPVNSLLARTKLDSVAVKYILRTVKIVVWSLAGVMVLDRIGVPVTSLLTVLAAVGAAVALAIKDNLSNLASGIVLLFTKPFKAGDFIEVDGTSGTIREIGLMHTLLDTIGNMRLAIPNNKMMTATITNYSTYETRRQDFLFSIGYGDSIPTAKTVLLELADSHPLVIMEPEPPRVMVKEYGDSAVVLLLRLWCRNEDYWDLQFDMNEKVKDAFDRNGISIPYPQLDVHVHTVPDDCPEA